MVWIGLLTYALAICDSTGRYCAYGTTNDAGQNVLTIHSAAKGWTSIGIGTSMLSCTEIYLIWKNSKGELVLSARNSSSHSMPVYNHASRSHLTNPQYQAPEWANLAASIVVPYKLDNDTLLIYASSDSSVQTPDQKNSNFYMHDSKGSLTGLYFPKSSVKSITAPSKALMDGLITGQMSGGGSNTFGFIDRFFGLNNPGMGGPGNRQGSQSPTGGNAWGHNPTQVSPTYPSAWTQGQQGSSAWGQQGAQYPTSSWGQQGSTNPASAWGQQGAQYPSSAWGQQGSTYPASAWGQQGPTWNQYPSSAWGQQGSRYGQTQASAWTQGQGSSGWNQNAWGQRQSSYYPQSGQAAWTTTSAQQPRSAWG